MADTFLSLPVEDRREALRVATDRSGREAGRLFLVASGMTRDKTSDKIAID